MSGSKDSVRARADKRITKAERDRMIHLRDKMHLTVKAIAVRFGYSESTVNRVLSGDIAPME